MNRIVDQTKASASNTDATKEFFNETNDQILKEVQALQVRPLYRTQDVKILLPRFSIVRKGEITEATRPAGHDDTTFLDRLNRLLIEGDLHYSKFKFERKSNFKPSLINSLGIFENQTIYKKLLAMLHLVGQMYQGQTLKLPLNCNSSGAAEEEEKKEEEPTDQALTE